MKHLRILITAMLIAWFAQVDAQIKISALPTLTAPDSSADYIPIVHSGTTYKVTPGKLFFEFGGAGGGSTPWYLNGNTVGSEKWLGTADNYALPFRTNNTEKARIDASGYFMIGLTSSPQGVLHVKSTGSSAATNNFFTQSSDGLSFAHNDDGQIFRSGILFSRESAAGSEATTLGQNAGASLTNTGVQATLYGYRAGTSKVSGNLFSAFGVDALLLGTGGNLAAFGDHAGNAHTTGDNCSYFGARAGQDNTTGGFNMALGSDAAIGGTNLSNVLSIHSDGASSSNKIVIGGGLNFNSGATVHYTDMYIGRGETHATPNAITIHATSGAGTDIAGANLLFAPGQATGSANSGDMIWQYAPSGSSGTTLTTLTEGIRFKGTTGALTLNSTLGAFTPNVLTTTQRNALTASDGMLIYNSTDGEFNFREAGAWTTIGAGGGGGVTSVATTSPITGGTITTTGTIGINDAAADGSTKGAASFTAADFNSSTGLISLDYTNGQAASGSTKGFLTSADWTTFNGKQAAGSYLTADGAVVGALSQLQAFTSGIGTGLIDDNGAGEFLINVTGADRLGVYTTGLQTVSGSAASPSYSFFADNTSGLYLKTANTEIGASVNGALVGGFNTAGLFANIISEMSAANGVTIDGVNLKDGLVVGQYGGTGVNNSGKTITLGGNLETSGANNVTFTTSGATNVTLPTSGTLVNSAVTTLSSLASIGTVTTGTWNASVLTGQYGGTGVANTGKTLTLSGNTTIGSSTHTVDFATGANTSVTLPASGTLATLAGTETFTNKSIVGTQLTGTAYTFAANNTNATAAYTLQRYEDHDLATYSGTVDFNGTDPSSITSQQYAWSRVGNTVTLFFSIFYGTPGTTNTSATFTMPSDCPAPATFATGGDAASEYIFPISGARVEANMTANPSAVRGGLRRNAANDGYEVLLIFGSVSAAHASFTLSYRTQ